MARISYPDLDGELDGERDAEILAIRAGLATR